MYLTIINVLLLFYLVDENMKRAQRMDAVKEEKFYFRTNITTTCTEVNTEPTIKGNAIFKHVFKHEFYSVLLEVTFLLFSF